MKDSVDPSDVILKYKLSFIMAYHCFGAEADWEKNALRVYSVSGLVGWLGQDEHRQIEIGGRPFSPYRP